MVRHVDICTCVEHGVACWYGLECVPNSGYDASFVGWAGACFVFTRFALSFGFAFSCTLSTFFCLLLPLSVLLPVLVVLWVLLASWGFTLFDRVPLFAADEAPTRICRNACVLKVTTNATSADTLLPVVARRGPGG